METLSYCQLMERMLAAETQVVELTAENEALRSAIIDHSHSVHSCEICGIDDPCSTDDVCRVLSQTPVTDRIVAGIKADGAGEVLKLMGCFSSDEIDDSVYFDVKELVEELRKGAK